MCVKNDYASIFLFSNFLKMSYMSTVSASLPSLCPFFYSSSVHLPKLMISSLIITVTCTPIYTHIYANMYIYNLQSPFSFAHIHMPKADDLELDKISGSLSLEKSDFHCIKFLPILKRENWKRNLRNL